MIEVTGLTKDYGPHRAIDHLNFKINKGEVVGFLGPNGAGKSTTMKIITGFMAPTSGYAKICGFDVFEDPIEVKKRIGYLPETPPVYTDMFVRDYLRFVAKLKLVEPSKVESYVENAIEKTNLQSVANRLIQNLSKGFKQRVGIAQALVSQPEVLVLDEPTVGLDPKQVAEVRDLIKELRGHHTIILSTHILSEVQAICERVIIINRGKIAAEDTLANLENKQKGVRTTRLRIRRDIANFAGQLSTLAGVHSVIKGEKGNEWLVESEIDEEILETISSKVVGSGAGLVELSSEKANLEDIFIELTYGKETEARP
ncbi:MAG: ABC transporter ATP-binding protein [Pseudobdellovibrionaceae bacterium]